MLRLLSVSILFSVFLFSSSSCKKCITCVKQSSQGSGECATCTVLGNQTSVCEGDLGGFVTIDQYISSIQSAGGTCTKTGGSGDAGREEKLCHTNYGEKNTAITARVALESQGFTCTED